MGDLISRQQAIDAVNHMCSEDFDGLIVNRQKVESMLKALPSAQSEMIKEIRRWINSGNRGNADYFIVDRIEEIINSYEIN